MSKVLILANHYNTLRIFRRELLKTMSLRGHTVIISIPECDEENKKILESYGCKVIFTKMERRGMNPVKDFLLLLKYISLITKIKPDKVITYTIKPNIYGALSCKLKHIEHYVNITGLGSAFQEQAGKMRTLVTFLYRISLNKANKVFFENQGNRDTLINENVVKEKQAVVMAGAGVNLKEFCFEEYPQDQKAVKFLFVGRIMKEKGIDELFSAIQKVKLKYPHTEFEFIGWCEEEYQNLIDEFQKDGYIQYYGFQNDVKPYIRTAHCVILPSWHEGMSNTLLESAAMGRPLITTDINGCKEAVLNKKTGFIVKVRNEQDLFEKIEEFINLPYDEKRKMGQNGRRYIENRFDKEDVVKKTVQIIGV